MGFLKMPKGVWHSTLYRPVLAAMMAPCLGHRVQSQGPGAQTAGREEGESNEDPKEREEMHV